MADDHREFSDFVEAGLPLLKERDHHAWELGDLAAEFVVKLGRPSDPDAPTLGDLASAWDVALSTVSEWRRVAIFYPENVRTYELSWSHHKLARSASEGELGIALAYLAHAKAQYMGIAAFRRYLEGVLWEGELYQAEVPERLRGLIPHDVQLWVTVRRYEDD